MPVPAVQMLFDLTPIPCEVASMAPAFILRADPVSPRFWPVRRRMLRCLGEQPAWQAAGFVSHRVTDFEDIGAARGGHGPRLLNRGPPLRTIPEPQYHVSSW